MYRVHLLTFKDTCSFMLFESQESSPKQGLLLLSLYNQMALPVRCVVLGMVGCAAVARSCRQDTMEGHQRRRAGGQLRRGLENSVLQGKSQALSINPGCGWTLCLNLCNCRWLSSSHSSSHLCLSVPSTGVASTA